MSKPVSKYDRVLGCLLGGAVGDAAGAAYEGRRAPYTVELTGDWFITDDTQLTLATCDAIVAAGCADPATIATEFARAFRSRSLTRLGASTYQALEMLAAGGHWALVGRKGEHAAGNGAAMRAAPLAFGLDLSDARYRQNLRDISRITHHSDEAYAGALAVVAAIQAASTECWNGGAGLTAHVATQLPDTRVRDRLLEFGMLEPTTPLALVAERFGNSGYVVESVPLALFAAQQTHASDFTTWMTDVVSVGGDVDTIASMAGQIVGCRLGAKGIPGDLVSRIQNIDDIFVQMTSFAVHVVSVSGETAPAGGPFQ